MAPFLYVILLHIPASNLMHKNDKKRLEIAKSILFHIHKHCTTSFTSKQPIFTSQQPIFTVFGACFVSKVANSKRENEIKMIKRDWKLPNPSYFTYTSIVQPVLQVYNPFLQADSPFSQLFGCL